MLTETQSTSTADESQVLAESSVFNLFHHDLSAPAMSTDMSQVGVALFPSFQYIFYHSISSAGQSPAFQFSLFLSRYDDTTQLQVVAIIIHSTLQFRLLKIYYLF